MKFFLEREMVHTDPLVEQMVKWAAGGFVASVTWIAMTFYTRLNRHSKRMDEHTERMSGFETAAAVREQMLMTMAETMGKMEAGLLSHMSHEEANVDNIKDSINEIKTAMAVMAAEMQNGKNKH